MTVRSYSTTPAANNAAPPNGAPEGMQPSAVNNTLRQVMADVRDTFEQLPYFDYGHTPTRIDNDTFTVPTDLTALYAAGIRLKLVGASTGYATVASSSYSAPDTTVNVTMDSGNVPTALSAVSLTSVDILLRSDLANTTTAGKGNDLVSYRRTTAEALVTITNFSYRPGFVPRYGTAGDNVTDDSAAILQAFAQAAQPDGADVVFEPGKTYFIGNCSTNAVIFSLSGLVGKRVWGNGARLRLNTTNTSNPIVLQLLNCRFVEVHDLRITDDGADHDNAVGAAGFDVRADNASDQDIGHISFYNCEVDNGQLFLRIAGNDTGPISTNQVNRIRDVRVWGGRAKRVFYGINCQNHGDDCHFELEVEDIYRGYFCYGVINHRFDIHYINPRGGYSQCLIKAYDRSTEAIKGRLYFETAASGHDCVTLEFENATQTQSIRDIDIELNCRNANASATPLRFRAFDGSGVLRAIPTTNLWDNIRLSGDWSGFNTPIVFDTRQSTEGRIYLNPSLAKTIPTLTDWTGFAVQKAVDEELRTVTGNLTTNSITIPCARYDAQRFSLEVTISIIDPTDGSTSAAAVLDQRDLVDASNSSGGGAVTVLGTTNIYRRAVTSASITTIGTVTYTGSGENLVVSFSTHTNTGCHARVSVKHLRGYL